MPEALLEPDSVMMSLISTSVTSLPSFFIIAPSSSFETTPSWSWSVRRSAARVRAWPPGFSGPAVLGRERERTKNGKGVMIVSLGAHPAVHLQPASTTPRAPARVAYPQSNPAFVSSVGHGCHSSGQHATSMVADKR